MASSSIVRLGPNDNNLSAQLLRNAITSFFQKTNVDDDNDNSRKSDSRFVIRNKYFSANIDLKGTGNQQEEEAPKDVMEDGLILVFDAVRSNPDRRDEDGSTGVLAGSGTTFDSLQSAHETALSKNTCGDLLRLCVGASLAELSPSEIRGKDHEKEYSRRILWCLDNGYEYIEADLSEAGKDKGHDSRDKDGFARIVEAIEGTVWSSAAMSTSKSNKLKDSFADSKTKIQESKCNDDSLAVGKNEEVEENQYVPPDPSLLATPADAQTPTREEIQKNDIESKSDNNIDSAEKNLKIDDSVASIFGLNEGMQETDPEDLNADKLFVQMESLLKEASQIRKASTNLSDEERRERAGNAALALVDLMGQFGLDEDEEGEDSDEYGSDDSGIVDK
jgi:hypothetical protein